MASACNWIVNDYIDDIYYALKSFDVNEACNIAGLCSDIGSKPLVETFLKNNKAHRQANLN